MIDPVARSSCGRGPTASVQFRLRLRMETARASGALVSRYSATITTARYLGRDKVPGLLAFRFALLDLI